MPLILYKDYRKYISFEMTKKLIDNCVVIILHKADQEVAGSREINFTKYKRSVLFIPASLKN